jgi:virulence-associated protein VapD
MKIKENQLTKFFRELGEIGDKDSSLGFGVDYYEDSELKKQLLKMGIKSDQGYIYFNELLYRCMRRKYGNMKISKKMQIFELRTQYNIYLMTLEAQNKMKKLSNEEIYTIIKKENGVNPFLTVMNFKITFKTWLKHARKNIVNQRIKNIKEGQQNEYYDMMEEFEKETETKMYRVKIEVEDLYELTSEEDEEVLSVSGTNKKSVAAASLKMSSQKNLKLKQSAKVRDHLKLFEKKMTQKFNLKSSMKKSQTSLNKHRSDNPKP